jgi:ribosomal protein S6--L-glutamate ligase
MPRSVQRARKRESPLRVICILSRKKSLYSTRRLVQAAKEQGHRPIVLDTLRCNIVVERDVPQVRYGAHRVPAPDVVIPRIGASITGYGLAVVSQFEMMGVPVLNGSLAIARSRDKLRSLQLVARSGIRVPRTLLAHHRADVPMLLEQVGGLPAIIKLIQGTQGIGVMLATSMEEAETLLNTFWDLGHDILLQEFIQESSGRDVRALVIGDRVVAAMRRQAKAGEFRSNIHRGGQASPVELPKAFVDAAIASARVLGLELAGVDMLESKQGPMVLEINSSPGFEGMEGATKLDIAGSIIAHAARLAGAEPRDPTAGPSSASLEGGSPRACRSGKNRSA